MAPSLLDIPCVRPYRPELATVHGASAPAPLSGQQACQGGNVAQALQIDGKVDSARHLSTRKLAVGERPKFAQEIVEGGWIVIMAAWDWLIVGEASAILQIHRHPTAEFGRTRWRSAPPT